MVNADQQTAPFNGLVCVGIVIAPQGLKGTVKIKSYTERAEDIASYGPLTDKTRKKTFQIRIITSTKKNLIVELSGVENRNESEKLRGLELYVDRSAFPNTGDGEFYFSDLIGLEARNTVGQSLGKVKGMDNFGAGDMIELDIKDSESVIIPFTLDYVPVVDLENRFIVIDLPDDEGEKVDEIVRARK